MDTRWQFRALKTQSGNVITDWLGSDAQFQARCDSYLRRLQNLPMPWPFPYYGPLGDGVGEIRFDLRKVEHRLYGYFGELPGQFTVLIASSDKKKQERMIQEAKNLRRRMRELPMETEEYVV